MYAAYDQYIEPKEKYLFQPEGHESLYEYLLECYRRISKDIGDYGAFVTPVLDTYSETPMSKMIADVEQLAAYLKAQGLKEGDVVTAFMPTCAHAFPVMYAVNKLGMILNFVHPLTPPDALLATMKHTKSKFLFILDAISGYFGAVMEQYPCVVCRTSDYCDGKALMMAQYNEANNVKIPDVPYTFYKDAISQNLAPVETVKNFGKKDAFYLQGGGTTGKSKTIILSSYAFNALSYKYYLMDMPHDYRNAYALSALPCFHAFGLGGSMIYAICNAFKPIMIPKFDAEQVNNLVKQLPIIEILGVPKMFQKMLEAPNFENEGLKNFKMLFSGGDIISDTFIKQFDETIAKHGSTARLCRGYGLTEMAATVTSSCWQHFKTESTGYPLPGVELQIWDEDCKPLPNYEIGEIVLAGENMMNGYLPDENIKETGIYIDENGKQWVRSGDMGYLDDDGYLFFSGRKKRIIIIAGYNIYPATIEDQITKLDYINEVCAVQGYSAEGKPLVKLCVSLKDPNMDHDEVIAALKDYCKAHIEGYACPRKFEILDLLPRTKIEKIDFVKLSDPVPQA